MIAAPRRWQVEVDADGEVLADGERLEAALDALIENAVAATGTDGRILLRARAPQPPVRPLLAGWAWRSSRRSSRRTAGRSAA